MNHIEIRKVHKGGNWYDFEWFIDGIRLSQYLMEQKNVELPQKVEPFDDLCPAWTKESYSDKDWEKYGDTLFWKKLIVMSG